MQCLSGAFSAVGSVASIESVNVSSKKNLKP